MSPSSQCLGSTTAGHFAGRFMPTLSASTACARPRPGASGRSGRARSIPRRSCSVASPSLSTAGTPGTSWPTSYTRTTDRSGSGTSGSATMMAKWRPTVRTGRSRWASLASRSGSRVGHHQARSRLHPRLNLWNQRALHRRPHHQHLRTSRPSLRSLLLKRRRKSLQLPSPSPRRRSLRLLSLRPRRRSLQLPSPSRRQSLRVPRSRPRQ
mmetsp:Transcript_59899/g.144699  ORF Transcript_59899/g.144699 Transcript_59899/m.144699 type:complete len:210 (+) Transcript_59899:406-1035(+)